MSQCEDKTTTRQDKTRQDKTRQDKSGEHKQEYTRQIKGKGKGKKNEESDQCKNELKSK
jgi:hypothetical protein